jgi:Xaa-Pro aminopeptidase
MTVVSASTIPDHLDFLVMQPDQEHAIVRDLVSAVFAFNAYSEGEPLQISFPMYTDEKVSARGVLGPCVRVTGPAEKLYVLTLRYEVSAHLRAGRAMTLVRDKPVIEAVKAGKSPIKVARARPLVLTGHSRVIETAGKLGVAIRDEAAFVERAESKTATEGEIDLLGFSNRKTVPVLK